MIPTTIFRAFKPELREQDLPAGVIGQVAGIAVVFDAIDDYGTTFARTSLDRTIRERVAAGKVKLYWDHGDAPMNGFYDSDLHIGTVKSIDIVPLEGGGHGAYMVADIFDTPKGKEAKQYLQGVLASGGETGLSVGGRAKGIKSEMVTMDGQQVERFTEFPLREISITSMQAVPNSTVLAVRATMPTCDPVEEVEDPQDVTRAGKTASVDGVEHPATDFAYVPDPDMPSTWKLPVFDADHARNALARFDQAEIPEADKAKVYAKVIAACNKFGIDVTNPKAHRTSGTTTFDGMATAFSGTMFVSPVTDQAAAFRALLRAMPEHVIRAELRAFFGNATTGDSDAEAEPQPSDSDATAEDSQPTDQVVYATMDERITALRSLYRKAS